MKENKFEGQEKNLASLEELIPGIDTRNLKTNEDILDSDHRYEFALEKLNPRDPEYKRKSKGIATASQYAYMLEQQLEQNQELRQYLSMLADQVVIDIGAGKFAEAYSMIYNAGAKAYIGVDQYFAKSLHEAVQKEQETMPLPAAVIKEDALTFLKRLPSNSVSIFCSALTEQVISDKNYIGQVDNEITRVLNPSGAYFNYENSVFKPTTLQIKKVKTKYSDLLIFSKT